MADGTRTSVISEAKRHFLIVDALIRLVKEKPLGTLGLIVVLLMSSPAFLLTFSHLIQGTRFIH